MRIALVLMIFLTAVPGAGAWEASSYRAPNGELIREGMKKPEVKARLGTPAEKHKVRQEGVRGRHAEKAEAWSYRFAGETAVITFVDDRITTIETIRR